MSETSNVANQVFRIRPQSFLFPSTLRGHSPTAEYVRRDALSSTVRPDLASVTLTETQQVKYIDKSIPVTGTQSHIPKRAVSAYSGSLLSFWQ